MGNKSHSKIKQHDVRGTRISENRVALAWSTTEEGNVSSFAIENQSAQVIGELNPRGGGSSYSFTDLNASNGQNTYKLNVNFVGGETYCFDTVTVD